MHTCNVTVLQNACNSFTSLDIINQYINQYHNQYKQLLTFFNFSLACTCCRYSSAQYDGKVNSPVVALDGVNVLLV